MGEDVPPHESSVLERSGVEGGEDDTFCQEKNEAGGESTCLR